LLRSDRTARWKHRRGYCCPPQLARTIAKMHGFAYSTSDDALWVHLYGSNELIANTPDGNTLKLIQETDFPWDGEVKLTLDLADSATFALRFRVPSWATGAKAKINGSPATEDLKAGTYASLSRTWRRGDTVKLSFPMRVRLIQANPLVEELRGQVAVMRGPIVYCLESVDLPEEFDAMNVRLPRDVEWTPRFVPELLSGVTVLEGEAAYHQSEAWPGSPYDSEALYRDVDRAKSQPLPVRLIPYHAWLNRGASQMTVWLPLDG
jgi:DUF1680 family protein